MVITTTTMMITRLSSNLRPTTCECVHLVTRGHFRSRDKDGRWSHHSIRHGATDEYGIPKLHANFMFLCFTEPELLPIKVLHCGNTDFRPFCSCDLDLDSMTFKYELDAYSQEIYRMCKYELPTSRLSKVIRQTDSTRPKLYTTPLRGWSVIKCNTICRYLTYDQKLKSNDLIRMTSKFK